jgi:hypothetical protein
VVGGAEPGLTGGAISTSLDMAAGASGSGLRSGLGGASSAACIGRAFL